jgi:hypothetical protein
VTFVASSAEGVNVSRLGVVMGALTVAPKGIRAGAVSVAPGVGAGTVTNGRAVEPAAPEPADPPADVSVAGDFDVSV